MHLKKLALFNFRSHHNLTLDELTSFVQIIGPNGSGKTNILEAISLLSPGRGLHHKPLAEMLSSTQTLHKDWAIRADLGDDTTISTGALVSNISETKRTTYISGEKVTKQDALLSVLRIIWLTPQMDDIFLCPSSNRRKFLDRITYTLMPEHASHAAKYDYFMRSRLKLLLNGTQNASWLTQMEEKMAHYGSLICQARFKAIDIMNTVMSNISNHFPMPILDLTNTGHATSTEEALQTLRNNRSIDAQRGRTHFGPHRMDFTAKHPTKEIAAGMCSTGEQKAMLVALVIAQAKSINHICNHPPIVLLDELYTHLDTDAQQTMLNTLQYLNTQVWTTNTSYSFGLPNESVIHLA